MSDRNFIRYTYLRDLNGNPHTCIAIQLSASGINYATATHNIEERRDLKLQVRCIRDLGGIPGSDLLSRLNASTSFTKNRAREIATARLVTAPTVIEIDTQALTYHDITREVMQNLCSRYVFQDPHHNGVPTRVEDAAYMWLRAVRRREAAATASAEKI